MKPAVTFDADSDAAYIRLSDGQVEESEEVAPGFVLDFDRDGRIVGIEVLEARRKLSASLLLDAA